MNSNCINPGTLRLTLAYHTIETYFVLFVGKYMLDIVYMFFFTYQMQVKNISAYSNVTLKNP